MESNTSELPLYNCHKQVRSARITGIGPESEAGITLVYLSTGGYYRVDEDWRSKHSMNVGDYLVFYNDGYVSVSPAKPFEEGYSLASEVRPLDFGDAIRALKKGKRVAREGWNGRDMYLWLLPAAMVKAEWCREPHLKAMAETNGGEIECLGSIRMMTADNKVLTGWLASQTDMLATDWMILE